MQWWCIDVFPIKSLTCISISALISQWVKCIFFTILISPLPLVICYCAFSSGTIFLLSLSSVVQQCTRKLNLVVFFFFLHKMSATCVFHLIERKSLLNTHLTIEHMYNVHVVYVKNILHIRYSGSVICTDVQFILPFFSFT